MDDDYVPVCRTGDVAPGQMKAIDLAGVEAVVANVEGRFVAFGALCPHEAGPLVEGELDGETVTCPWHFTQFNVLTGEADEGGLTDEPIPVYEVRVEGDAVLVRKS